MKLKALFLALALIMALQPIAAQHRIPQCGGGDPPPTPTPTPTPSPTPTPTPPSCTGLSSNGPIFTSWGKYFWQVDLSGHQTATFSTEVDFDTNPGGLVSLRIPTTGSLPCTITVHRLHGSFVIEAQQLGGGSCTANSYLAQVLDQNGNVLASGTLAQFAPSHSDLPIKASFSTPLTVSNFIVQVSVSPGCDSGISWQLVMN